jgi:putative transcriptional regulator
MKVYLKEIRLRNNLTQAELAEKTGCTKQTISRIENRLFIASIALSLKIAKVLGADIEDFYKLDTKELNSLKVKKEKIRL